MLTIDLVGSALARGEFAWLAMGCILGGVLFVVLDNTVNNRGGFLRKSSTVVHYLRRKHRQRFKHALDDLERIARFADLLIAATTAAHGLPLYARNPGDFLGFDGIVRVVGVRPVGAHESPRRCRLVLSDAISTGG